MLVQVFNKVSQKYSLPDQFQLGAQSPAYRVYEKAGHPFGMLSSSEHRSEYWQYQQAVGITGKCSLPVAAILMTFVPVMIDNG